MSRDELKRALEGTVREGLRAQWSEACGALAEAAMGLQRPNLSAEARAMYVREVQRAWTVARRCGVSPGELAQVVESLADVLEGP